MSNASVKKKSPLPWREGVGGGGPIIKVAPSARHQCGVTPTPALPPQGGGEIYAAENAV